MHSKKARRAAALLLVLGLLVAAAPSAAAPDRAPDEPAIGSSLLQALTVWIAWLLPPPGPLAAPAPAWAASGSNAAVDPEPPGQVDAEGDPTSEPELGSDIDPDG